MAQVKDFDLFNEEGTDFSNEYIILMAMCLEFLNAAEMICYGVSRKCENSGYKDTFFQNKKMAISESKKCWDRCAKLIDVNFKETMDKISNKIPEQASLTYDSMLWLAKDIIRLSLDYHSRCDSSLEKREKIHKAIMNFKEDTTMPFNREGIYKYLNLNIE